MGPRPIIPLHPETGRRVQEALRAGKTYREIERALGVSRFRTRRVAVGMGLRRAAPGHKMPITDVSAPKPEQFDRHAERCLALGGFPAAAVIGGKTVWPYPAALQGEVAA